MEINLANVVNVACNSATFISTNKYKQRKALPALRLTRVVFMCVDRAALKCQEEFTE